MNIGHVRHCTVYQLRRAIKASPALYMAASRLRHSRISGSLEPSQMMEPSVLNPRTQIVIEGPRRSGNTFAVVAFRVAQPAPIDVGHHLHAAAHVITAVKREVPCLVLLRDPEDTVVSSVASFPPTTVSQALGDYVSFYERLTPHRERFLVATFEQVTTDFGMVISALNERFGTVFTRFDHTDENVARCFRLIEQRYDRALKAAHTVARPSQDRHEHKQELRKRYLTDTRAEQRERAQYLFDMFNPS